MACKIHKRKNNNQYLVYFNNPLTRENKQISSGSDLKEVLKFVRETDCKFYTEHPYLVPSGISLDTANKRFRVYNRYKTYQAHHSLMGAVKQKQEILEDLTSPKYEKTLDLMSNK